MYAIIEDSGQQFKVSEGDVVNVDLKGLDEKTDTIEFDRVLMVADGENVTVGTPLVDGAKVVAEVVQAKVAGKKVVSFKYRRRKASRRKIGHRQKYTQVRVKQIVA